PPGLLIEASRRRVRHATARRGLRPDPGEERSTRAVQPSPSVFVLPPMPSTTTRLLSSVAVVTLLAGTAGAGNYMEGRWRAEGGVGVRFGSLLVNNMDVGTVKQG